MPQEYDLIGAEILSELKTMNQYKKCELLMNITNDKFITVHSHGPDNVPEIAHVRVGDITAMEEIGDRSTQYKTSILLKPLQKSFFVEESFDEINEKINRLGVDMNDLLHQMKGLI